MPDARNTGPFQPQKSSFQCFPETLTPVCDFVPAPPGMAGPIPVNCRCVQPPIAPIAPRPPDYPCTVTIVYPAGNPQAAYLAAYDCEPGAAVGIALSLMAAEAIKRLLPLP